MGEDGGGGEDVANDTYGFYVRQYNDDQDARGDEDLGEFDEHAADYGDHFAPTVAHDFQDYMGGGNRDGGEGDGYSTPVLEGGGGNSDGSYSTPVSEYQPRCSQQRRQQQQQPGNGGAALPPFKSGGLSAGSALRAAANNANPTMANPVRHPSTRSPPYLPSGSCPPLPPPPPPFLHGHRAHQH